MPSQVVIFSGIPFALAPLVLLTRRRGIMGKHANRPLTRAAAGGCALVAGRLNGFLLWQQLLG